jgi:plastocyanin
MKRHWIGLGILAAPLLVGSHRAWAHEGHDHGRSRISGTVSSETAVPPAAADANVVIKLFQFQPGQLQVKLGTTVTWVNEDEILHTVTLDDKAGSSFDAPLDGKGKSFSFTFTQAGVYRYYCDRHEHMRGEIEVR